jgi:hypothetical protein
VGLTRTERAPAASPRESASIARMTNAGKFPFLFMVLLGGRQWTAFISRRFAAFLI